jgi:hypothetical protein
MVAVPSETLPMKFLTTLLMPLTVLLAASPSWAQRPASEVPA